MVRQNQASKSDPVRPCSSLTTDAAGEIERQSVFRATHLIEDLRETSSPHSLETNNHFDANSDATGREQCARRGD